jgi:hypothetical protein
MDDAVRVRRVVAIPSPEGRFRFQVEIESGAKATQVLVSAQELLDFDCFQTAVLEQTGRLVMAPCGPGAEGPDHYRRHRRVWCNELQSAIWQGAQAGPPSRKHQAVSVVPRPKSQEHRSESPYRHG